MDKINRQISLSQFNHLLQQMPMHRWSTNQESTFRRRSNLSNMQALESCRKLLASTNPTLLAIKRKIPSLTIWTLLEYNRRMMLLNLWKWALHSNARRKTYLWMKSRRHPRSGVVTIRAQANSSSIFRMCLSHRLEVWKESNRPKNNDFVISVE